MRLVLFLILATMLGCSDRPTEVEEYSLEVKQIDGVDAISAEVSFEATASHTKPEVYVWSNDSQKFYPSVAVQHDGKLEGKITYPARSRAILYAFWGSTFRSTILHD